MKEERMVNEKRWMSIKDAAEYLGVNGTSLYRACRKNWIPSIKSRGIGVRVDRVKLDAMLENQGKRS
jgi:excisionase family DNA binding protein